MAIAQVGMLPVGCSPHCGVCVTSSNSFMAYCSANSIIVHKNTAAAGYRLHRIFGSSVMQPISNFALSDTVVAAVTSQNRMLLVWSMANGELLSKRLLNSVLKDDGPTVVATASIAADPAKPPMTVLIGTTGGRVVAFAGDPAAAPTAFTIGSSGGAAILKNNSTSDLNISGIGLSSSSRVECIAVSPKAANYGAAGTANGTVCIFSMQGVAGTGSTPAMIQLQQVHSSLKPFSHLQKPLVIPVHEVAYDPHNVSHLLAASREGHMAICDISSATVLHSFDRHRYQITSLSWLPSQPGTLCTTDGQTNALVLWNVGSKVPVQTLRPVADGIAIRAATTGLGQSDSASCCLLGLGDGSVAVYDVGASQAVVMRSPPATADTLYDLRFSHHDRDLLATSGFDGMLRVWNIKRLTPEYTIDVGRMIIYTLDWSAHGKYIVVGMGNGEVAVYSTLTLKESWRSLVFNDAVWRVAWSKVEGSMLGATSRAGVAILSSKDGKVVRRFPTKTAAYGIDFEPVSGKLVVVSCHDGKILVYNLQSSSEQPAVTLAGHMDAAMSVMFNPCVPQFVLSGANDNTARVWDISSMDSHTASVTCRVLKGHVERVRGLAWCHCAPQLVLSGSADNTVRLWDTRNGVAVTMVRSHNNEVFAIDSHPERPFVFATASRDTTVMFWHLAILRQVQLEAALGTLEQSIVADPAALMAVSSSAPMNIVSGEPVKRLLGDLRSPNITPMQRLQLITSFFEFPYGAADVVSCAGYILDPASIDKQCTVLPTELIVSAAFESCVSSMEKARGKVVAAAGVEFRSKRLVQAADECLAVGRHQEACELLLEAEQWDRAIATAPLISREFWRRACLRAAAAMAEIGDPRAAQYFILGEDAEQAASLLLQNGQATRAAGVLQTCPQNPGNNASESAVAAKTIPATAAAKAQELLEQAVQKLANSGNPRLSSATLLALKRTDEAIQRLVSTGDVVLAHLLVHTTPVSQQETIDEAFRASMLLSGRQRQWETLLACAARHSNVYDALATALAVFQHSQVKQLSSSSSRNAVLADKVRQFHQRIGTEAQRAQLTFNSAEIEQQNASNGLASIKRLAALVLAADGNFANVAQIDAVTKPEIVASIAGFVESILQFVLQNDIDGPNTPFYLKQAYKATGYVVIPIRLSGGAGGNLGMSLNMGAGDQGGAAAGANVPPEEKKFLALCFTLAALMSVKVYRFPQNLNVAFTKAREFAEGHPTVLQLLQQLQPHLGAYSAHSEEVVSCSQQLGSGLPTMAMDGKMFTSLLTPGESLDGNLQLLEDGVSVISRGEALAWFKCCWFSPLGTGTRMLPY